MNILEDLTQEESTTKPDSLEEGLVDIDKLSDPLDNERRPEIKAIGTKLSYFQLNILAAIIAEGRFYNPDTKEESDSLR